MIEGGAGCWCWGWVGVWVEVGVRVRVGVGVGVGVKVKVRVRVGGGEEGSGSGPRWRASHMITRSSNCVFLGGARASMGLARAQAAGKISSLRMMLPWTLVELSLVSWRSSRGIFCVACKSKFIVSTPSAWSAVHVGGHSEHGQQQQQPMGWQR